MRSLSSITTAGLIGAVLAAAGVSHPDSGKGRAQASDWSGWLRSQAPEFTGAVVVGRDDRIDFEAASGPAGAAGARPNTPETRFNLGSINKTFTAVAVAQLVQQGRLGLDDTLAKHIPDYPNREAAARITIRQLLTHQSGVGQFMRADFGDVAVADMVRTVGAEPQVFEPGARQAYSNGGYVVLGRIVEVVSGLTYEAYVRDRIYRPAGMTATGFYSPDVEGLFARPVAGGDLRRGNPAGGGYSTAADLFRFSRALKAGRLLDRTMTAYVLDGTFAEQPPWGFSLREQTVGTHRFIGNGGGAPGVNAEFRFEPAGSYSVVVLANASPPAATSLLAAILARIAGTGGPPSISPQSASPGAAQPRGQQSPLRRDIDALHADMMAAFRAEPARRRLLHRRGAHPGRRAPVRSASRTRAHRQRERRWQATQTPAVWRHRDGS